MGSEIFLIFSRSSEMKLLTLIVALFMMAQASDELREFHIREEDSGNLRSLRLPSKVVRQAEETEVDKLGEEPRNLRSLEDPESQAKLAKLAKLAKKTAKLRMAETSLEIRCGNYQGGRHVYGVTCDCNYMPGGCSISRAPPAGYACCCVYKFLWYCVGAAMDCRYVSCPANCLDEECCKRGGGDCGGYVDLEFGTGKMHD